MSTKKMKVAVIGLGAIGKVVANNLVKGGREVLVASRKLEDAKSFAKDSDGKKVALDLINAINTADIVVMAVWFSAIQDLLKQHRVSFEGKIVVDPSNPIAPDGNGGFKKIINPNESAGEVISNLLPKGATIVKAFGTLGAETLAGKAHQSERSVLFYALDDRAKQGVVEELIHDSGFEPAYVGGIDQSIKIEVFGELHEYGALGKAVTLAEAKSYLELVNQ